MIPKSTRQAHPYVGWSTLNKKEVLQTTKRALSEYRRIRPALKIRFRKYTDDDGETRWRVRSDGKPMCDICITETKRGGVRLDYKLAEGVTKKIVESMKHEAAQIHEHIKYRIDAVNNVGVSWGITGIPKSPKKRLEWQNAWIQIETFIQEHRLDNLKDHTYEEIQEGLRYQRYMDKIDSGEIDVDDYDYGDTNRHPPPYSIESIRKITTAGLEGKLSNSNS